MGGQSRGCVVDVVGKCAAKDAAMEAAPHPRSRKGYRLDKVPAISFHRVVRPVREEPGWWRADIGMRADDQLPLPSF